MSVEVYVRTRGFHRADDYRWTPAKPSEAVLAGFDGLYTEEQALLLVAGDDEITLKITGLSTGRRDEVGTDISSTLLVRGARHEVDSLCWGVVRLASEAHAGDRSRLAGVVEGMPEDHVTRAKQLSALAQELPPGASAQSGAAMFGSADRENHRESFRQACARIMAAGDGFALATDLADHEDLAGRVPPRRGEAFVLGVGTSTKLRTIDWPLSRRPLLEESELDLDEQPVKKPGVINVPKGSPPPVEPRGGPSSWPHSRRAAVLVALLIAAWLAWTAWRR